jgi:hypothetical protein
LKLLWAGVSPASFQISKTNSPKDLPAPPFSLTTESLCLLDDLDFRSELSFRRTLSRIALPEFFRSARALLLAGSGRIFEC